MEHFSRTFWILEELDCPFCSLTYWSFQLRVTVMLWSRWFYSCVSSAWPSLIHAFCPSLQFVCEYWRWVHPWCRERPAAEGASPSASDLHFSPVFPTLHQRGAGKGGQRTLGDGGVGRPQGGMTLEKNRYTREDLRNWLHLCRFCTCDVHLSVNPFRTLTKSSLNFWNFWKKCSRHKSLYSSFFSSSLMVND